MSIFLAQRLPLPGRQVMIQSWIILKIILKRYQRTGLNQQTGRICSIDKIGIIPRLNHSFNLLLRCLPAQKLYLSARPRTPGNFFLKPCILHMILPRHCHKGSKPLYFLTSARRKKQTCAPQEKHRQNKGSCLPKSPTLHLLPRFLLFGYECDTDSASYYTSVQIY